MTTVSAIVTTAGSATANAYCDVAFADQFHVNRSPQLTTWVTAGTAQKTAAILWATMLMDRLWEWVGYPTDNIQALLWPRTGALKPNGWEYVDFHTIPVELQRATAEYAAWLVSTDRMADSDIETQGVASLKAGPVALTFREGVTAKNVPDSVVNLIPPDWGYVRGTSRNVRQLMRA